MAFDLKTAIGSFAPTIATMLGGPLAGTAVNALVGAFGLTSTGDTGKDTAAITAIVQNGTMTSEVISAVRLADQKHAEIMSQQGIDLAKLNADHDAAMAQVDAGDRDSARKRETSVKDWTPRVLAYLVTCGFFSLLGYMVTRTTPSGSEQILDTMIGTLGTAWVGIITYYFGSSAGSDKKTDLIAQANAIPAPSADQ